MDDLAARIEDDEAGVRANAVGSRELPALSGSGVDGDEFDPVPVLGLQGRPHGAEAVSRSSRLDLDEVDLRGGDVACGAVRATVVRRCAGEAGTGSLPLQPSANTASVAAAVRASARKVLLRNDRDDEVAQATLPVRAEGGIGELASGVEDDESGLPDEAVRAGEFVALIGVTVDHDEFDPVAVFLL